MFGLKPGNHKKPHYYSIDGEEPRPIVTADIFQWIGSHGIDLSIKTMGNHQSVWNAIPTVSVELQKEKSSLLIASGGLANQQVQEVDRLIELMEILRTGTDIDAIPPTYSTAITIWGMRREDWINLMNPWLVRANKKELK